MTYQLFADASGYSVPRRCGWGFVLRDQLGKELTDKGWVLGLNVNRTELRAVLEGLWAIEEPSEVEIYTDSVYVIVRAKRRPQGIQAEWLHALKSMHQLKFIKVGKGNPHPDHTRAHHLAREAVLNAGHQLQDDFPDEAFQ